MADYAIFYFIALLENLQNVAGLSVIAFALHHGVVQLGIELAAGVYLLKALLCEYTGSSSFITFRSPSARLSA